MVTSSTRAVDPHRGRGSSTSRRRSLRGLVSSLGLLLAAGVLVAHFSVGLTVRTVLSGSMSPAIEAGDRVLTLNTEPQRIHRGEVVLVNTPDMTAPLAHRVHDVRMIADAVSVRTKGDANASPDEWTNLLPGAEVPVVVAVLPAAVPGIPSTWGSGPKVLLVLLLGLGVTATMVVPQWRRRPCDCDECTAPAASPCPSCGDTAAPQGRLVGATSAPDSSPHDTPTATKDEVTR
ncbi:signal peptidase I [Kineococcus rubinsiae]|uniref:signal peptidase I n=1 Tax=Kineococcus rubinsiae TaxID=2609562 RepID=UPI00142F4103|nr:signal peptidase I [Kineococcus rubinsiae]